MVIVLFNAIAVALTFGFVRYVSALLIRIYLIVLGVWLRGLVDWMFGVFFILLFLCLFIGLLFGFPMLGLSVFTSCIVCVS